MRGRGFAILLALLGMAGATGGGSSAPPRPGWLHGLWLKAIEVHQRNRDWYPERVVILSEVLSRGGQPSSLTEMVFRLRLDARGRVQADLERSQKNGEDTTERTRSKVTIRSPEEGVDPGDDTAYSVSLTDSPFAAARQGAAERRPGRRRVGRVRDGLAQRLGRARGVAGGEAHEAEVVPRLRGVAPVRDLRFVPVRRLRAVALLVPGERDLVARDRVVGVAFEQREPRGPCARAVARAQAGERERVPGAREVRRATDGGLEQARRALRVARAPPELAPQRERGARVGERRRDRARFRRERRRRRIAKEPRDAALELGERVGGPGHVGRL